MKNLLRSIVLALAGLAVASAASAGAFLGERRVNNNTSVGQQFPEIAYANGIAHVVWEGFAAGKQADIFYARSTDGVTFSTPLNLSNNATGSVGNNRPQVAVVGSVVIVAWNSDNNTGAIYTARSVNSGGSFAAPVLTVGAEGGGYSRITGLFASSASQFHLTYYTSDDLAGVGHVHHRMSCDLGATWPTDTTVTSQGVDGDFDNEQPRIGEAGGRMYLVYRSSRFGNPQGGWVPYSVIMQTGTVSGCAVSWSYPGRRIAGGVPFTLSSTYRPEVLGDSSGKLHLAWWDNTAGAQVAYRDGSGTPSALGPPATLSAFGTQHLEPGGLTSTPGTPSGGFQMPPALASNGTTAFVGYYSNSSSTNGLEHGVVVLRESSNNGSTWGGEQNISTSVKGSTPRFSLDTGNTNNVGIVWTDFRDTTAQVFFRIYTLGGGSTPLLSAAPDPNFGDIQVGTTTGTTNITVTNAGGAGNISGVSLTGTRPGDYGIVSNTCSGAIGAGGSCTVGIQFSPKALGTRAATLNIASDGNTGTAQLTGNGVKNVGSQSANVNAVVTGYYETILGRSPDGPGQAFWASEATRVQGLGADVREVFFAMSISFFNSAEYGIKATSDTQYVTDLYRTFFIREPDGPGLTFWLGYISQGVDRGALLTNFLFSTEFSNFMTNLFGSTAVRPEIDMTIDLYRGILGALPDSSGFNFWLGQIRTAQCSGSAAVSAKVGELAGLFVGSQQYIDRENARPVADRNRMYVGDLYNAFLRRGAEPTGYNFWAGQLNTNAQTRDQVRNGFLQSPEFQARVNAVIAAGCFGG